MTTLDTRENELKKILRYIDYTKSMYYQTNLVIHSHRVHEITKYLLKYLKHENLNEQLALNFALIHDDEEILTGDILSYKKDEFTKQQKLDYEKQCQIAKQQIISQYKNELNHTYEQTLNINKNSKEYALIKFADKIDAHGEVCHEILAGNSEFTKEFLYLNTTTNSYNFTFQNI